MNTKVKIIFVIFSLMIFLSFLTNGLVNAKQTKNVVQVTELELELWYNKAPPLYQSVHIDFSIDSFGEEVTINIILLNITNSTHTLNIYYNPGPIYLDNVDPYFYDWISIDFNKTETWNITLFVETAAGDQHWEDGQFEVSPFRLGIYHMYESYVNNPTEINIEVEYYDTIPNKDISIEVLLDDYLTNTSIYNSLHTFTIGPDTHTTSFYYAFDNTDSHKLWLNVTDLGTKQQWFTWDYIYPEWINVTIHSDYQLFVGNITKIEIELNSYLLIPIEVDATLYIDNYYGPYDFDKEITYSFEWTDIQLNPTNPRFNDSIYLSFEEHGEFDVWLDVVDEANDEFTEDWSYITVWNEIDLRIYQPMEIWVGDDFWVDLDIYYFKSQTVTANIEVFIDDGTVPIYLYQENGVTFFGQTPYTFNCHYWSNYNSTNINKMGYFDVWFYMFIQETSETIFERCWFYVRGEDTTPPKFKDISGLTDGETYSDEITITANITDDQSDIYNVDLYVKNENYTGSFNFGAETEWFKDKTYCHCYATLKLDTANIYDGKYEVTIEAEDGKGFRASEKFSVRFENGYIYEPSDGDNGDEDDDDDDDKISPGFEGIGLILSLIVVAGLVKRRK